MANTNTATDKVAKVLKAFKADAAAWQRSPVAGLPGIVVQMLPAREAGMSNGKKVSSRPATIVVGFDGGRTVVPLSTAKLLAVGNMIGATEASIKGSPLYRLVDGAERENGVISSAKIGGEISPF